MLGEQLRQARTQARLSIYALALQSGIGIATISDIERGKNKNPGILTVARLADVLQVSLDTLAERAPAPRPTKRQRARKAASRS